MMLFIFSVNTAVDDDPAITDVKLIHTKQALKVNERTAKPQHQLNFWLFLKERKLNVSLRCI